MMEEGALGEFRVAQKLVNGHACVTAFEDQGFGCGQNPFARLFAFAGHNQSVCFRYGFLMGGALYLCRVTTIFNEITQIC